MKKNKHILILSFVILVFTLLIGVFSISFASSRCNSTKLKEISLKEFSDTSSKEIVYSEEPTNYLLKSYKSICETGDTNVYVEVCTIGLKENTCNEIYYAYNENEVNMEFISEDRVKINNQEFNFKYQAYNWKKGIYSYKDNN